MGATSPKWSTLIIRLWLTEDAQVRARLTELDDVQGPERAVALVGNADDVLDATRAWLTRVLPPSKD
jgi:16S rRNA G1207 methylase RsmC